ncbi:MAG: hypothetical protein EOP47_29745, partial [Sphingobacteriaceae bacterium]
MATVVFSGNTFKGNAVGTQGGALYFRSSNQSVEIENTTFDSNTSLTAAGGAIYSVLTGTLNIKKSTFLKNKALASNSGAIYLGANTKDCLIEDTRFEGNEANTTAGAIYFSSNSTTLKNNKFYNNKATTNGGALFIYGLSTALSAPQIISSIFYNNTSMFTSASATSISGGGAIFGSSNTAPAIINSTFYGNSAQYKGGAIVAGYATTSLKVYNSIFYANNAQVDAVDIANLSAATDNVDLKHTITQQFGTDGLNGNMVGLNPEFDSEDAANPDFLQLQQISQAVNAGENSLVPATATLDIAGNNRIIHGVVDLGAIEYNGPLADPLKVYIDENSPNGTLVANPTTNLTGTITWTIFAGNTNNALLIEEY